MKAGLQDDYVLGPCGKKTEAREIRTKRKSVGKKNTVGFIHVALEIPTEGPSRSVETVVVALEPSGHHAQRRGH